jgi:hypothetical protein
MVVARSEIRVVKSVVRQLPVEMLYSGRVRAAVCGRALS